MKKLCFTDNAFNAHSQPQSLALPLILFAVRLRQSNVRVVLMLSVSAVRQIGLGLSLLCVTLSFLIRRWVIDTVCPPPFPFPFNLDEALWTPAGVSNNESLLALVTLADNQFTGYRRGLQTLTQWGSAGILWKRLSGRIRQIISYLLHFCIFTLGHSDAN